MQTLFLKIFVCKLVENHLSAILTNFCQSRRRFQYSGRAFLRSRGEDYCSTLMQRTLALSVCLAEINIYKRPLFCYIASNIGKLNLRNTYGKWS